MDGIIEYVFGTDNTLLSPCSRDVLGPAAVAPKGQRRSTVESMLLSCVFTATPETGVYLEGT